MTLALLQIAYPAFSFCLLLHRWGRPRWAAIRKNSTNPGLYAAITPDAGELHAALAQDSERTAAEAIGGTGRTGSKVMTADRAPTRPVRRHCWVFPGAADQVRQARRLLADVLHGCPAADDLVLCLSELAANAVRHSASGQPGGTFTVRAEIRVGSSVLLEVEDNGGPWQPAAEPDGRMHGLGIVREFAAGVSTQGNPADGWIVSARFSWPVPDASRPGGQVAGDRNVTAGDHLAASR